MARQAPTNYIGPQGVVTVQNGSVAQVNQTPASRHVTVTPLISTPTARVISAPSRLATIVRGRMFQIFVSMAQQKRW